MKSEVSTIIKLRNAAFPSIIFLLFITLSFLYFNSSERETLRSSTKESLTDIADYEANNISNRIKEEISDAELITGSKNLIKETEEFIKTDISDYEFEKSINQIKTEHSYSNIYVFDTQGKYLHSTNPAIAYDDSIEIKNLSDALSSEKTFVSDIYTSKNDKKQYIDIFSFIRNDDDLALACVLFRIEPKNIFSDGVQKLQMYHETAKTTIIKKDDRNNYYRYNDSDTSEVCWNQVDTAIFENKFKLSYNTGLYIKGLNDEKFFISVSRYIPNTPWYIIVQVDKNEIFRSINKKFLDSILAILIMFLCYSAIIYTLIHINYSRSINKKLNDEKIKIEFKLRFEMLMDLIDEGVLITDSAGLITSTNIKYQTITGFSSVELKNLYVDNVFTLIDNSTGINIFNFRQTLVEHAGLTNYSDVQLVIKNGKSIPVVCEITPLTDDSDGLLGIMITIRDISDNQEIHELLKESENSFLKLFQEYPYAALLSDINGNVEMANVICNDILGYTISEMYRLNINDIFKDNNYINRFSIDNEDNLSDVGNKVSIRKKDGSIFTANVFISTVNINRRRMIEIIIRNNREMDASETELSYEGENLKDALIANMNHEIRTPLNDIIGFSHILRDKGLTSDEVVKYSDLISSSAERLLNMLNNLVDISKIEAGLESINKNTFLVADIIKSVYNEYINLAKIKNLEYKITIPEECKGLKAVSDYLKISTILSHFLSNAFKFTNKGYVEIGLSFNDETILFYVKDTGLPIKYTDQKKIFERFFQSDASISSGVDGAGLGLAICKGYSDLLGCKIWFENAEETGKTFFLELPRQQQS